MSRERIYREKKNKGKNIQRNENIEEGKLYRRGENLLDRKMSNRGKYTEKGKQAERE